MKRFIHYLSMYFGINFIFAPIYFVFAEEHSIAEVIISVILSRVCFYIAKISYEVPHSGKYYSYEPKQRLYDLRPEQKDFF